MKGWLVAGVRVYRDALGEGFFRSRSRAAVNTEAADEHEVQIVDLRFHRPQVVPFVLYHHLFLLAAAQSRALGGPLAEFASQLDTAASPSSPAKVPKRGLVLMVPVQHTAPPNAIVFTGNSAWLRSFAALSPTDIM